MQVVRGFLAKSAVCIVALTLLVAWFPAHASARRPDRWVSCAGIAPQVDSCRVTFRIDEDYRVERFGRGTGVFPRKGFTGRIEAGWEGGSRQWWASKTAVDGAAVQPSVFGYVIGAEWDHIDFSRGDTVTLHARVDGTGPWTIRTRLRYVRDNPPVRSRWYRCSGIAPMDRSCETTFTFRRLATEMWYTSSTPNVWAPTIHKWPGYNGFIAVEIASPTARWTVECTEVSTSAYNRLSCKVVEGKEFRPGERVTMRVTATGSGPWSYHIRN